MIKFLRNIRKSTLKEGKIINYLKYAIGEIILVVIGILIALSINNWNEKRKNEKLGKEFLSSIKQDLTQDLSTLERLTPILELRLSRYRDIDLSTINYINIDIKEVNDTIIDPKYFVYPHQSFRPKFGTYNSLLSEGKTGLITNRDLFDKIQDIYEVDNGQIKDSNVYIDAKSKEIMWQYRNFLWCDVSKVKPLDIKNPELIASLNYLQNDIARYVRLLKKLKVNINNVIALINDELEKQ